MGQLGKFQTQLLILYAPIVMKTWKTTSRCKITYVVGHNVKKSEIKLKGHKVKKVGAES